jgi:hypothetical protein
MYFPVVATTVMETEIAVTTKSVFLRSSVLSLVWIPPKFWAFYFIANNTSGHNLLRSRGGAVGWGTALQSRNSRVRFSIMSLGFFLCHNPSGRIMVMGSTHCLTEMSTRNISWGEKGGRCLGLPTLPPSCADCLEIWETQPPGNFWACLGLYRGCFTFALP